VADGDDIDCRGTRASWGKVLRCDNITAVGAQKIITVEDLVSAIEQFSLHVLVPLTIKRDCQILNLQVPLLNEQQPAKPY
jgi:S1-C subfamily serine protease